MNKAHAAKLKAHQESYREILDSAREIIAEEYEKWHDNYMQYHVVSVDEAQVVRAWRPRGLQVLSRVANDLGVHPNALVEIAKDFHLGELWKGAR